MTPLIFFSRQDEVRGGGTKLQYIVVLGEWTCRCCGWVLMNLKRGGGLGGA